MKKWIIGLVAALICIAAIIFAILYRKEILPDSGTQTQGNGDMCGTDNGEYLIDLGNDLYILRLVNVSGVYVEDGKDEKVESVAGITVQNRGKKTLQLANIYLYTEDGAFGFRVTTLPPGETVMVQDGDKQVFPEMEKLPEFETEHVTFFQKEPSLHKDVFEIATKPGSIEIKNISDKDIEGPIYIYYKTKTSGCYQGGITYRVQVAKLGAGESYSAYAGHFYGEESQVMFVDYAK